MFLIELDKLHQLAHLIDEMLIVKIKPVWCVPNSACLLSPFPSLKACLLQAGFSAHTFPFRELNEVVS